MTRPLVVVVTERAAPQVRQALAWWRENRPAAADLLEQELRNVLVLVASAPTLGASASDPRVKGVRRVLLRRSRYHVYYRVDAAGTQLEVLALWHASRREPRL